MRNFWKNNNLSIVLVLLFLLFWGAQSVAGMYEYNSDQREHGQGEVSYLQYLKTGAFLEATAENWESEFLQMFAYVLLTAFLIQKGSSESKDPEEEAKEKAESEPTPEHLQPGWLRAGGLRRRIYEHSLSLTFLALFLISMAAHAIGGAREYSEEQMAHGQPGVSVLGYLATSRFWFESFQNWQSEFLAVLAMVVLSIWLREKDSPESKPVDAPHSQTGA